MAKRLGYRVSCQTNDMKTERKGFDTPCFQKSLENQGFRLNRLVGIDLRSACCTWISPVNPHCGVWEPGQKRDKSRQKESHGNVPFLGNRPYRTILLFKNKRLRHRRSRQELEAIRLQKKEQTENEIDAIYAEYRVQIDMDSALSFGVIYARYSTDFQHSIGDQVRSILVDAQKLGIYIRREHICYDIALRGYKERRPGFEKAMSILRTRDATTLLVFTTNRLFRKMYKSMKFVEEDIVSLGLRCVFTKSGIDTDLPDEWRLRLQILGMLDEMSGSMYAENIRAAQEGLFRQGYVFSTVPFGYMGVEVEGTLTKTKKLRMRPAIDTEYSHWVEKIFNWFVCDRLPMIRILERLNDQKVPSGPQSDGTHWTHNALHYLLTNPAYRGLWAYGKGKSVWLPAKDYAKRVLRDKPLCELQFEHLRIIPDDVWFKAQELIAQSPQKNAGRKPRDGNHTSRPRILNGLLFCTAHQSPLKVTGDHGKHMTCMKCRTLPKAKRPLYSYLNRTLALRLVCRMIGDRILNDQRLIADLFQPFVQATEQIQSTNVCHVDVCQKKLDKLSRQIEFLLDNPGDSERDREESKTKLKNIRTQRISLELEMSRHVASQQKKRIPTEADFHELVTDIGLIMEQAASSTSLDPENNGPLRELLEILTGGKILVEQMGERLACRGWLRLRIPVMIGKFCESKLGVACPEGSADSHEILVDVRETTIPEDHIHQVKELYDQGMLVTAIGLKLNIDRHYVTDAIRLWHERNGLEMPPDGRARRAQIQSKSMKTPVFQQIADEAKRLYDEGLLIEDMAVKLGRDRDTVKSALRFWHSQNGLTMPDLRNRRKTLKIKNRPKQ